MESIFKKKRNVVIIAIFYTFLWGLCFPLVKLCMSEFDVIESDMSKCLVAGIRFTLSGLGLTVYSFIKSGRTALLKKKAILSVTLYGVLATSLQYAFTYVGLSKVDGAKGAIFDQLCVFIIVIVGGLFLKNDKLTPIKLLGCALGFIGVLAISTEKMSLTFTVGGELMMTFAALCQAGSYFIATLSADKISAFKLVGYGQLTGGALLSIFALTAGGRIDTLSTKGIVILIALALFSAVAYVLSLIPLKYFPASEVSVFNLLITVFGVVLSGIVLGENIFRINYLISLSLICAGISLVNWRRK